MNWLRRVFGSRDEPPPYWRPAERVKLVWDFGEDDDDPVTFTVEAPTAAEAREWGTAAEAHHSRFAPGREAKR